jgi:hypothetical protein
MRTTELQGEEVNQIWTGHGVTTRSKNRIISMKRSYTMKITLKNTIALGTAVALTLAFGMAYAADDEASFMNTKDTGTALYEAFLKHDASLGSGSAAGGVRMDTALRSDAYTSDELRFMNTKDTGTELYENYLKHEADIAKGSSAGGVRAKEIDRSNEYTNDEAPRFPGIVLK